MADVSFSKAKRPGGRYFISDRDGLRKYILHGELTKDLENRCNASLSEFVQAWAESSVGDPVQAEKREEFEINQMFIRGIRIQTPEPEPVTTFTGMRSFDQISLEALKQQDDYVHVPSFGLPIKYTIENDDKENDVRMIPFIPAYEANSFTPDVDIYQFTDEPIEELLKKLPNSGDSKPVELGFGDMSLSSYYDERLSQPKRK